MRLRWLYALAAGGCLLWTPAMAAGNLVASSEEPRAYGYSVGDVVLRQIKVTVPEGLKLDEASLPKVGRVGQSFELRRVQWQRAPGADQFGLALEYQLFRSPPAVRTLELPPVILTFAGTPRAQDLRIDAWPVTIAPLVPVDVSPRRGLGEMQPDLPPPLIDTRASRYRLMAYGTGALLAMGYLLHVYAALPWLALRQRPFERAWRQLRRLPGDGEDRHTLQAAFRCIHEGLNGSAGAVLFESGVAAFVAAQPRFAPLRDDLAQFFAASRQAFFAEGPAHEGRQRMSELKRLCVRLRNAERGAA